MRRIELHDALAGRRGRLGVPVHDRTVSRVEQYGDHVSRGRSARALPRRRRRPALADPRGGRPGSDATAPEPRPPRWGLRRHFAIAPCSDSVEVTWARALRGLRDPDRADDLIGVAVLSSDARRLRRATRRVPRPGRTARRRAGRVGRARRRPACASESPAWAAGRVLLAGDAAGYIDALTGEGLALAFATAEVLVDCLVRGRPDRYERACDAALATITMDHLRPALGAHQRPHRAPRRPARGPRAQAVLPRRRPARPLIHPNQIRVTEQPGQVPPIGHTRREPATAHHHCIDKSTWRPQAGRFSDGPARAPPASSASPLPPRWPPVRRRRFERSGQPIAAVH